MTQLVTIKEKHSRLIDEDSKLRSNLDNEKEKNKKLRSRLSSAKEDLKAKEEELEKEKKTLTQNLLI